MANRKRAIPQYGTVTLNGLDYYRTRVQDADGKVVALYARTPEELYDKELNALEQIDNDTSVSYTHLDVYKRQGLSHHANYSCTGVLSSA